MIVFFFCIALYVPWVVKFCGKLGAVEIFIVSINCDSIVLHVRVCIVQVTDPDSMYVDPEERKLSVYIEWQESHLLISPNYNSQDDVTRLHKHQMT